MVDRKLLDILVCPQCKGPLVYEHELVNEPAAPERLVCTGCRLAYRVDDDIPVMLVDEAVPI